MMFNCNRTPLDCIAFNACDESKLAQRWLRQVLREYLNRANTQEVHGT